MKRRAACSATSRPVRTLPVSTIASTWSTRSAPVLPGPRTMRNTASSCGTAAKIRRSGST